MFCWKCGNQTPNDSKFCPSCGTNLLSEAPNAYRTHPPAQAEARGEIPVRMPSNPLVVHEKRKDIIAITISAAIVLVIAVALFFGYRSRVLVRVMDTCRSQVDYETWDWQVNGEFPIFQLSDGGRTLIVDGSSPSSDILACIIDETNMPDSVLQRINQTRALDGTLSDSWDNILVSWNYHPDNGVNMVFEVD